MVVTALKEYRIKRGLTQKQVAAQANITERNYQYYEHGERLPNVQTAVSIANVLHADVKVLWGGNPTEQTIG